MSSTASPNAFLPYLPAFPPSRVPWASSPPHHLQHPFLALAGLSVLPAPGLYHPTYLLLMTTATSPARMLPSVASSAACMHGAQPRWEEGRKPPPSPATTCTHTSSRTRLLSRLPHSLPTYLSVVRSLSPNPPIPPVSSRRQ
ncbi:uncharacterized protein BKA78DRAFT_325001 [Phyllosticta capitalensis]|uniref:uncharacterized protein n=1 Tax=Phyllosticta capitalensis TaxID=121624 RepID=UPI00312D1683